MKKILLVFAVGLLFSGILFGQGTKLEVPQLTADQKQEVLYNHVIAYAATGISFAKTRGVSPYDYGVYIGDIFSEFWNPEDGMFAFAAGMMNILSGLHPDNQMEIVKQTGNKVIFQLKNVDLPFRNGPAFGGVTLEEYLACSDGIISTLAAHMNVDSKQEMLEDGWYRITMKAK